MLNTNLAKIGITILTHNAVSLSTTGTSTNITMPNMDNYDFIYIHGGIRQPAMLIKTGSYYRYASFSFIGDTAAYYKSGYVTLINKTNLQVNLFYNAWGSTSPFDISANSILGIQISQ